MGTERADIKAKRFVLLGLARPHMSENDGLRICVVVLDGNDVGVS